MHATGIQPDFHAAAVTGSVTRLDAHTQRIVAPNPSALTGPGTNTYVLGAGATHIVIDPGPGDDTHLERILAAAQGRVAQILCTHSHPDHSPGAALLRAMTGAPVLGRPPPDDGHQDETYAPDATLHDGDVFRLPNVTLRALHTPGHASNHVCFLLEEQGWLFTGDHLMSGSTVVILPPDGSMRQYLDSLRRLEQLALTALVPGHGAVIPEPHAEIRRIVAHRLRRESRLIDALQVRGGTATLDALLPTVYSDVPVALHGMARYSLLAHVLKLEDEGRLERRGDTWHWRQ
jgi:glyoxylase-like metal-dependent hydrolase (beta-lactamase superfamily II)